MASTRSASKRKRARTAAAALDRVLLNPESLACVGSFLAAKDLCRLSLTRREFCRSRRDEASWIGPDELPLAEEASMRIAEGGMSDEERAALSPRRGEDETWVRFYHRICLRRAPLAFTKLFGGGIVHHGHDRSRVISSSTSPGLPRWTGRGYYGYKSAVCGDHVMAIGRHYAEFSMEDGTGYLVGVVRPIEREDDGREMEDLQPFNDQGDETEAWPSFLRSERAGGGWRWGDSAVNCCLYVCYRGLCGSVGYSPLASQTGFIDWNEWEGQNGLGRDRGRVGLLLDLNVGTLAVYKNGRRLGVMKRGLSGEYCWLAMLDSDCYAHPVGIERLPVP